MDISIVEQTLGLVFNDKHLLQRALTHRSYLNENREYLFGDNERLEFLGDAVLDFVVGEYLYRRFVDQDEGTLTSLRAALVRTEALADFAMQVGLGQFILLGHGEEESGGRDRPAVLCGAFESLIGALYIDQGLGKVNDYMMPIFEPALDVILENELDKDAKSALQELSQAYLGYTPRYHTVETFGPDHDKQFVLSVTINGVTYGRGAGRSKQIAAQAAAMEAMANLQAMLDAPIVHVPDGADFELPE
ncbi:MAG: ribonuclease III [Anaerolineae bacterium]|nr:ribonuclease III [Anaerolineae bacterium]